MIRHRVFDVLIVYSEPAAVSAGRDGATSPFRHDTYVPAYAYFLEQCRARGLTAAFTTTRDISGPGRCRSYWTYARGTWTPVRQTASARFIFDKFTIYSLRGAEKWSRLLGSPTITTFNNVENARVFGDKYATYQAFAPFMIPTVPILRRTRRGVEAALAALQSARTAAYSDDFTDAVIVKDRFGAGGTNIFKVMDSPVDSVLALVQAHPDTTFVLQPFVRFDKGFSYRSIAQCTDIRLIYNNGSIVQTYLRRAKADDFRCNDHQGGQSIYVPLASIPTNVLAYAQRISQLVHQGPSLHTLDFLISNSGTVYFLEGNISPGLYWNAGNTDEAVKSKELIRLIVTEIVRRIRTISHVPVHLRPQVADYMLS